MIERSNVQDSRVWGRITMNIAVEIKFGVNVIEKINSL